MRQKSKWLIELWTREWKQCKKSWLRLVYTEILTVVVMCVIFIIRRAQLDKFVDYTLNMPSAIYAFWGITSDAAKGKAALYVQWILMPLQVWIAWKSCDDMIRSIWMEEELGNIFYLCNQWYSRQQIILAKYIGNVVKFTVGYFALYLTCAVLAGGGWGIGRLIGTFVKGLLVMLMLLSLSSAYAVLGRRKDRIRWTDLLVYGTLAAGNLYKVRDLFILLLQRANRSYRTLYILTKWLDGLKWLSPLSWLNPFVRFGVRGTVVQAVICIVVIGISGAVTLFGYRIRRFE